MHTATHTVTNDTAEPLTVWFEPWGSMLWLPPQTQFRLEVRSDEPGELFIDRRPNRIMVFAWTGCTIEVFQGAERISKYVGDFPALPPGLTMQGFITTMFGDPPPPAEGKADLN